MTRPADLHTHTVFSDGTTTPERNAELAAAAGLEALAVTDHDTMDGWPRSAAACAGAGVAFIPGVELSCEVAATSIHLLGYWCDPDDGALVAECARLRDEREDRAVQICARLAELGVPVDVERVRAIASHAPLGRPHIAAAMIEAGHVADIDEAFDRYLADDGPAWVPKHALAPEDGIEVIRGAGGVAVLAHPAFDSAAEVLDDARLDRLVAAGLAGVEADHPAHTPEQTRRWRALAAARGLAVTGASDFHGDRKDVKIGQRTTPMAVVEALRAQARRA